MKITLKRPVSVIAFKALMTIGEIRKDFDFYLSILELDESFHEISPELVNEHLLQRNPKDVMGFRIVKMMVTNRLLTPILDEGALQITEKGTEFLQQLKRGHFDLIENDLKQILVECDVLFSNNNGRYSSNGNRHFHLIYDMENEEKIRFEFQKISQYLEDHSYIVAHRNGYKMTDIGKDALEREKIPIAQSSSYVIYTTEDPLFEDNNIIAYEPIHLHDREWFNPEQNDKKKPTWLTNLIDILQDSPKIFRLPAQNLDEIYLYNIDGEVFPSKKKISVDINLILSTGNPSELRIVSEGSKQVLFEHKGVCSIDEVMEIVKPILPYEIIIFNDQHALLVPYAAIKENGWIDKKIVDYPLKNIEIPVIGKFEDLIIQNIKIIPKTEDDAINWAKDLILKELDYYFTEDTYEKVAREVSERFSQRFFISSRIPSFNDFLNEIAVKKNSDPKTYWFANTPRILMPSGGNP